MINEAKDNYYMKLAKAVSEASKCHYWHEGAVLVRNDRVVSTGYNGSKDESINCRKCGSCTYEDLYGEKPDGSQEQCCGLHAEISSILGMGDLSETTLYVYTENSDGKVLKREPSPVISHIIQAAGVSRIVL